MPAVPLYRLELDRRNAAKASVEPLDISLLRGLAGSSDRMTPRQGWSTSAWLRRCVNIRANALAGIPWQIRYADSDEVVWDAHDEMQPEGLEPLHGVHTLLYMIDAALALEGRAYALRLQERGARGAGMPLATGGRFTGLQWWSPQHVEEHYDQRTGALTHFERVGEPGRAYAAEHVVHLYLPDPYAEAGPGSADADAGRVHADVLRSLSEAADSFLDRGLIKAGLIMTPPQTQKPERDRIERWFKKWFRGKKSTGEFKVFNAEGAQWVPIGDGLKDLSDEVLTVQQMKQVAAALGVPWPVAAGDAANFATLKEEQVALYELQCVPQARRIQQALNAQLFKPLGLRFTFMPQRLPVMQRSFLDMAQAVVTVTGAPVLSVQEGRELLGRTEPMEAAAAVAGGPDDDDDGGEPAKSLDERVAEIIAGGA